jgi:hypothetical protein
LWVPAIMVWFPSPKRLLGAPSLPSVLQEWHVDQRDDAMPVLHASALMYSANSQSGCDVQIWVQRTDSMRVVEGCESDPA